MSPACSDDETTARETTLGMVRDGDPSGQMGRTANDFKLNLQVWKPKGEENQKDGEAFAPARGYSAL